MEFFPVFHEFEYDVHATCACLGLLGSLQSKSDGEVVALLECVEECGSFFVFSYCNQEVLRYCHVFLSIIGRLPSPIRPCSLHLCQSLGHHQASIGQPRDMFDIPLGPHAPCPSRGKFLNKRDFVIRFLLPIDPPKAQRFVEGFRVGDRQNPRSFFVYSKPNSIRVGMVLGEPLPPLGRMRELQCRILCFHQLSVSYRTRVSLLVLRGCAMCQFKLKEFHAFDRNESYPSISSTCFPLCMMSGCNRDVELMSQMCDILIQSHFIHILTRVYRTNSIHPYSAFPMLPIIH